MNKVHLLPKCPNNSKCVSLGCHLGRMFISYGCGNTVCVLQANTLIVHQITQSFDTEVRAVAFARTGGRLAIGLENSVVLMIPRDSTWEVASMIGATKKIACLSWSSFGDCLLGSGDRKILWSINNAYELTEVWTTDSPCSQSSLSPDGRLIALSSETRVNVYYKEASFVSIKLNHPSPVSNMSWKDISTFKLYVNSYNPNALLVATEDHWIKVWSEYYSPTGLGFNIVFQINTAHGMASWLSNYSNLENHISLLASKQSSLKDQGLDSASSLNSTSCILRETKSQPENLLYGAVMKERIPVEWLVIYEDTRIAFFCCEGLGAYPVTAINIRQHLELPIKRNDWAIYESLFAIKECEEIQLIGLNKSNDFMRWRKKFDKKDEEFELTSVKGGHSCKVSQLVCHRSLPLLCSVDEQRVGRVWSCVRGLPKDLKAVQHLMHWGVVNGKVFQAFWLDSFALLLAAQGNSASLYKWKTLTLEDLKMPSVSWESSLEWQCRCKRIEASRLEIKGKEFKCYVATSDDDQISVWRLVFNRVFTVEKVWHRDGHFINAKLFSFMNDSMHSSCWLYLLDSNGISALDFNHSGCIIWKKALKEPQDLFALSSVIVTTRSCIVFVGHDGSDQGQFESALESPQIFVFAQDSLEFIGILNKNSLSIMAQQPSKVVGQTEMQWTHIASFNFQNTFFSCALNSFHQFIVAHNCEIQVYEAKDASLFSLLSSVSDVKPIFHPLFLSELLKIQQENTVKLILNRMVDTFEDLNYTLNFDLNDLSENRSPNMWDQSNASSLKQRINDECLTIPGLGGDVMLISKLCGLVDSVAVMEAQSRSFDEFAKIFFLNVKMFKFAFEQKMPASLKPTSLTSMEVAWALHSEQQDTFFSILFNSVPDWNTMKMYGIGIWVRNPLKLKKLIEDIAMADFRKNKEPKNIALWYMAVGKKNILTELFKKDAEHVKIYNFMKNDFSTKEWQIKAQKNAYELRKQMKYEMSAAFFILGGQTDLAVEVLAEGMFDPQLAFVIARLKEGENSDLAMKVVKDYFLATALKSNDPWLASISYTLLGQHAKSVCNVSKLDPPPDFVPNCWNNSTAPSLSKFHPSLKRFLELLSNTIMVKRDCESQGIDLSELRSVDKDLALRSAKAYLHSGLPILALQELLKDTSDYLLTESSVKAYLFMLCKNCKDIHLSSNFHQLASQVRECADKFKIPERRLIDFVSGEFYSNGLRAFQSKFLVDCGFLFKGAEALLHQAALVHIVVSRISRDPSFEVSPESLEEVYEEMRVCLKILVSDREASGPKRSQLMHIGIAVYLCLFVQAYQAGSCTTAVACLQALEIYVNTMEFTEVGVRRAASHSASIIATWLRYLMVNKLVKILEKFKSREIDSWLDSSLGQFNLIECNEETVECALGPGRGLKKRPLMSIAKLRVRVKSWQRRIILSINSLVSNESIKTVQRISEIFSGKKSVLPKELSEFFSNFEEFNECDLYFEGNSQVYRLIQASAQSISTFIYEKPGKISESFEKEGQIYQESIQENMNLFRSGLELFKTKDAVLGFAINSTDKKNLVAISNSKRDKIREISLEHSLFFKKFNADLELDTEDPETYVDCMKQFDSMSGSPAYIYNPSVSASIHHLYAPQSEEFEQEMKLPPKTWHRSPLKSLLSSLSSFKSRQDKAEKITAHPMLPLYVTGNELLTLWQFNRQESLQDFATSSATSKITSLKFNSFGDKLGACDAQGNFYLYKFDLQPTSFQPQLTLKNSSGLKASNFCFLNLGSVIATVGHKPKGFLSIYDTLLPPNRPPIHTESLGGKYICYLSRYQQLLMSGKKGKILRYDLRMREVVETLESKHENITDLKLGPGEITFITAGSEGAVKIWDAKSGSCRESIDPAKKAKSKRVSQIECVDNTLFSSSHDGTVKLLRIIQQ